MEEVRKLSTILFADITGYTSMMQRDEQHSLELLNQFQRFWKNAFPDTEAGSCNILGMDAC